MAFIVNPVSLGSKMLNPFASSPATSLADYLPQGRQANSLLLGGCDPRKILYTLHMEQDKPQLRTFDFICRDEEPGILVRNILFLTLLLDTKDDKVNPRLWNVFHDFFIDMKTINIILKQNQKLARLSNTSESWSNSPYGNILQKINTETLAKLNRIWTKYANYPDNSADTLTKNLFKAINKIHGDHYPQNVDPQDRKYPPLARSFGLLSLDAINVSCELMQQFWCKRFADINDIPTEPTTANPTFLWLSSVENKFIFDYRTTPFAIYHFADTFDQISLSTKCTVQSAGKRASNVVASAKKQFRDWCKAFLRHFNASDRNRNVLRFVLADPLALCVALQQRKSPSSCFLANHSTPWSGTELVFDNADRSFPNTFNVIDTCYLCDHIGALNILVASIPLMEVSPASTIQMENTSRPWSEEVYLLQQFLVAHDTMTMCNLLGVAPLPYLTGVTTRGFLQDLPLLFDFSSNRPAPGLNRIIWKIPAHGDSHVTEKMKLSFDTKDFYLWLGPLYHLMFIDQQRRGSPPGESRTHQYVAGSYAAFIAFLKPRLSVDWDLATREILKELQRLPPQFRLGYQDLQTQLHFLGIHTTPIWHHNRTKLPFKTSAFSKSTGVLNTPEPPPLTCVVLSVPRSALQPIYKKCNTVPDLKCDFELRIRTSWLPYAYDTYSPLPTFGKLVIAADGKSCRIEKDWIEWHGSSDVHFCISVCTDSLMLVEPEITSVTLNLSANPAVFKTFVNQFGAELEIFRGSLLDENKVRLVSAIPGHETPIPPLALQQEQGIPISGLSLSDTRTADDESVSMSPPKIGLKGLERNYTRRLTLLTDSARQTLTSDTKITAKQSSPCTVTVTYGAVNHVFQFPYPVNGGSSTLRVSRKAGWFELCAPTNTPMAAVGGYLDLPLPLSRQIDTARPPINWNLPAINFNRLPRVDVDRFTNQLTWLDDLIKYVTSDGDNAQLKLAFGLGPTRTLLEYKLMISTIFRRYRELCAMGRNPAVGVAIDGETNLFLLMTGLFMDSASHNVVLDAYCLEVTPEFKKSGVKLPKHQQLDVDDKKSPGALLNMWKTSIPAMVERCRNWEHKETCEYETERPVANASSVCSCGKGKVQPDFLKVREWADLANSVVRFALTPLLPEPFVEQTREQLLVGFTAAREAARSGASECKVCVVCGSNGPTKCGQCEKVYYCGRECQRKDWKQHKPKCC